MQIPKLDEAGVYYQIKREGGSLNDGILWYGIVTENLYEVKYNTCVCTVC